MATLEETVFRPPLEHNSALLEIALGCSWSKCTFCRYSDGKTPLQLVSPYMLCENLEELAAEDDTKTRMFLLGGNVLAFKYEYLLDIFRLVQTYLPHVKYFAMYARADDVTNKSSDQLKALSDAGLDTLYIGVESGNAEILAACNKQETPDEIIKALLKLDSVNIKYGLSSILGLGGKDKWEINAVDTGKLYNAVRPSSIRVMTLTPMRGTPLSVEIANGKFKCSSAEDVIKEEILLLKTLTGLQSPCIFVGTHPSNPASVMGKLPVDREALINMLSDALKNTDNELCLPNSLKSW